MYMINFKLIFLILLTPALFFGQGLKFTPVDELNQFERLDDNTYGFSDQIPSNYSLEKYVPMVLEQEGGTCVGFSSLYYALSTMYNQKFGVTDFMGKIAHAFDPYFIYSILQSQVNHCDDGLVMYKAAELLSKVGAKKMFFPPYLTCNSTWNDNMINDVVNLTVPYNLKDFYIVDLENPDLIEFLKKVVYYDIPVVTGFSITDSMYPRSASNPNGIDSNGLWRPSEIEGILGGHAMTVVGYNDYRYGGAFRVVNSWGRDYGDNGFIWIKYADFLKYAVEAYVFELNEYIAENPKNSRIQMQTENYTRFQGDFGAYEGQETSDGRIYGKGIKTSKDKSTYFIGNFEDGSMEGYSIILDSDGLFSANAINNKFYDLREMGFAGSEESEEIETSLNDYLEYLNSGLSVRKGNSTKRNKFEKSIKK